MSTTTIRSAVVSLVLSCFTVLAAAGPVLAAPPPNDTIRNARVVGDAKGGFVSKLETANTTEATFTNEPTPSCGSSIGKTVWFRMRPSFPLRVVVDTIGSDFDTIIALYRPTANGLTQMACSDDAVGPANRLSRFEFVANPGITYYLQAGGYQAASGQLYVSLPTRSRMTASLTRGQSARASRRASKT